MVKKNSLFLDFCGYFFLCVVESKWCSRQCIITMIVLAILFELDIVHKAELSFCFHFDFFCDVYCVRWRVLTSRY